MPETTLNFWNINLIWIAKIIQDLSLPPPEQDMRVQFLRDERIIDIRDGWRARAIGGYGGSR
jgi:hypothetical protein